MRCPRCRADLADTSKFCAECGAPVEAALPTRTISVPASPARSGELLAGKYRVLDELGRGGMGVVVRAEDTRLKRTVALKFLSAELTGDPEARERFVQEARAASALEHPNICTIFEIDEAPDGRLFMAMACYEGESLRDRLKRGRLGQAEALSVAVQTARGLAKAHEKGIVHRDVKPGNVFLTDDNQAKILDFGLAKLVSDIRLTRTGAALGTLAYMSPEQAQGRPVDQRTDVWSLGVMLYEMLTGQLPFGGDSEGSLLQAVISRPARPLRKVDPAVPAGIERVVLRALEKAPADRYRTMADFLADLEALAEGLKPRKAGPALFRGRVLGLRRPVFFGGVALLAAGAALFVFVLPSARAVVLDSVAILPVVNETGDASRDYFAEGLTRELNTELYKVAALTVPPAETVLTYRKTDKPTRKIAQELGVKAVVHVSWLQIGNRHRLIYTMSDPFRNKVIATDRLEMEEEDIIFLQRAIARAVVAAVKVAVTPSEQALLAGGRKVDPEAYELCIRGVTIWQMPRERSGDSMDFGMRALSVLKKAVDIDPNYALAYAWISEITAALALNSYISEKTAYPEARAAALRAVELDENLAQAHLALSTFLLFADWDFTAAEQEAKLALELEPGNHWVRYVNCENLSLFGRHEEAIEGIRSLLEVPSVGRLYLMELGNFLRSAGRHDEAIRIYEKDPSPNTLRLMATAYALKGDHAQALALYHKTSDMPGMTNTPHYLLSCLLGAAGRREEALKNFAERRTYLAKKGIQPFYEAALVHASMGDRDEAFRQLDLAYEDRVGRMIELKCDPWLRSLQGDPRFEELARKIGFPVIPEATVR